MKNEGRDYLKDFIDRYLPPFHTVSLRAASLPAAFPSISCDWLANTASGRAREKGKERAMIEGRRREIEGKEERRG